MRKPRVLRNYLAGGGEGNLSRHNVANELLYLIPVVAESCQAFTADESLEVKAN